MATHYINSIDDLVYWHNNYNPDMYAGDDFIQTADLDLNGVNMPYFVETWASNYDGQGHKIINADLVRGFFGTLTGHTDIRNLVFEDCNVYSWDEYNNYLIASVLAFTSDYNANNGEFNNTGEINNCMIKNCTISGQLQAYAICAGCALSIINCVVDGCAITSDVYAAGIADYVSADTISTCLVKNSTITAGMYESTGMFISFECRTMTDCIVDTCNISSTDSDAAGIANYATAEMITGVIIQNCNLTGAEVVGGIIVTDAITPIQNCHLLNNTINAQGDAAGFIRSYYGPNIKDCSVENCRIMGANAYGVVRYSDAITTIQNCYSINNTIIGQNEACGFMYSGYGEGVNESCRVEECDINGNASAYGFARGLWGNEDDITTHYRNIILKNNNIISAQSAYGFVYCLYDTNLSDIIMLGITLQAPSCYAFTCDCYLYNAVMQNCDITVTVHDCTAALHGIKTLVGNITKTRISINAGNINLTTQDFGGFVTTINGASSLSECVGIAQINGELQFSNFGGFVANIYGDTSFTDCYARIIADGALAAQSVGGFAVNDYSLTSYTNCYTAFMMPSNVTITSYRHGFVVNAPPGYATAEHCYYDKETFRIGNSIYAPFLDLAEPRTTDEMTYPEASNTYVNWDFDEVWTHDTAGLNAGYPMLRAFVGFICQPPTLENGTSKSSQIQVPFTAYKPATGNWLLHYKITAMTEGEELINEYDTIQHSDRFYYSLDGENWEPFPLTGLVSSDMPDSFYMKAIVDTGPYKKVLIKAATGGTEIV